MIIEIATAAAMYLAENVTATAAESDIPQMRPRAALCRDRDPQKLRQCLNAKMQPEPDPYAAMWDPNWISSVTPVREGEQKSGSATTANPNDGGSKGSVASKPHARSN
jgi:hypothetical protein